jgi:hypothetical protein
MRENWQLVVEKMEKGDREEDEEVEQGCFGLLICLVLGS